MTDHLPATSAPGDGTDPHAEIARVTAELAQLSAEAEQLTAGSTAPDAPGTALVAAADAPAARSAMTQQLARLEHLQQEISTRRARLRRLMDDQLAAAARMLGPLQSQVRRMQEGIEAISGYLGIQERITTLRDGTPAPAGTPVALRQMVLSADQECLVAAEDGGLDVRSLDGFFAWLLADARHLDQVLPEPKGIVAIVPSRTDRRYGDDPWFNAAMKQANAKSFLLVRNGHKLFAVMHETELGRRLFPAADEFTALFRDHLGRPLEPGGLRWRDAEEKADATRRHYMSVGLLLQGLADRTTILHPHPDGGLDLLDQDAIDAGRVLLIPDAEDAYALTDGSERFTDWQRRVNKQLRPGMRIIVATRSQAFRDHAYGRDSYRRGHSRLHPTTADYPAPDTVHTIEERRPDGGLVIRYHRTDDVFATDGVRPAKVRASCTVYADDPFVLAYDSADPHQLRAHLRNRSDRTHYLDMVPVINAALAAKTAERAAEQPFRAMVAGQLMQHTGLDTEDAAAAAAELVDWWKFVNRVHRPLTGRGPAADAKAATEILAEHTRRTAAQAARAAAEVVQKLSDAHPDALLIAQKHDTDLVVLTPHAEGPFVTEHTYTRHGRPRRTRPWTLPGARPNRWTALTSTPAWESWDRGATLAEHLTGPERDSLAEQAIAAARTAFPDRQIAAVTLQGTHTVLAWTIHSLGQADDDHPATGALQPVTVEGYGFTWQRDRHRQAVPGRPTALRRRTWDRSPHRPWETGHGRPVTVLHTDPGVVDLAEQQHARHQHVADQARRIRATADAALRAAHTAWADRQEKAAYRQFLTTYADPSLWEGHRKTLHLPPMPDVAGTHTALTTLIEDGADLADHTLGSALAARGITDIPEDLRDLPLT